MLGLGQDGHDFLVLDIKGRVVAKTQAVEALSQTVSYSYNAAGQLTSLTTPSGQLVQYAYDNNRPVSVTVNGTPVLDQVFYEPFRPDGGWRWGNSTPLSPNLHVRQFDADSDREYDNAARSLQDDLAQGPAGGGGKPSIRRPSRHQQRKRSRPPAPATSTSVASYLGPTPHP